MGVRLTAIARPGPGRVRPLVLLALLALLAGCGSKEPGLRTVNGRTILMEDPAPAPGAPAGSASSSSSEADGRRAEREPPDLVIRADDARAGKEAAVAAAAQMGLLGDEALDAYVADVGQRLLRGVPRRAFAYEFRVVDQVEPNAFALPGGYIFLSRGLLALANSEDELANVIGHEITHAAQRHAARAQAAERYRSPLMMGWIRARDRAAYSRDMEREADEGGQILAAAAGYDPYAMSTLQSSLGRFGTLLTGSVRYASWFDSHPGTEERVTATALRASELRWQRDPALGDTHERYLRRIDGLPVGDRPEAGIFQGQRFLHPALDFQIRFPDGWTVQNTPSAVGAIAPHRDAVVFLATSGKRMPPRESADAWLAQAKEVNPGIEVTASEPVKVAGGDGWRLEAFASGTMGGTHSLVTFFDHEGVSMAISGMAVGGVAKRVRGRWLATTRSFRRLGPDRARGFVTHRIRIVEARPGESLEALVARTGSTWDASQAAVANGLPATHAFSGGELVKIAKAVPWKAPGSARGS